MTDISKNAQDPQCDKNAVISRLKTSLDTWIDSCEKVAGNLNDIGYRNEAQTFQGQSTAYWAVKTFLEENGF